MKAIATPKPTLRGILKSRTIPVTIRSGSLGRLGEHIRPITSRQPLDLVTDCTVDALFGSRAATALRKHGWAVHRTVLPDGESIKTSATIRHLHDLWFQRCYDRTTPIVALGGGALSDGVGFAAATFLRGLPLWIVPTTMIAQVDAAIGGKVGINHRRGKNLIGCYYHPCGIVIDPELLLDLPVRELRSGLAEVVKYGVIADPKLFARCERQVPQWASGEAALSAGVIRGCVRIKLDAVAADETDHGQRRMLNFGHTLGHALERWGGYKRLRHGEAVALGMVGISCIARARGIFLQRDFDRLLAVCRDLRPDRRLPNFPYGEIIDHLSVDKKRRAGNNIWIVPVSIGRVRICDDITTREIRRSLKFIGDWLEE